MSSRNVIDMQGIPLVLPDNVEEHVALLYRDNWRVPNKGHHVPRGANECPRKGMFQGK